jgi:hypothetical protein
LHKQEKYDSKVFNPPSIVKQVKDKGLYFNDPVNLVNQSMAEK